MSKDVELNIQIIPCHLLLILSRHPPLSSSLALSLSLWTIRAVLYFRQKLNLPT